MSEHELWNEIGNLFFMTGAYNQAAHAYQRSIRAEAGFGRPYSNLALTYVQQGKYGEAIELYRRSIELLTEDKEKAISWNRLGTVYRQLKDYSHAVIAFQEADELDPQSADDFPAEMATPRPAIDVPSSVLDEPELEEIDLPEESVETVAPVCEANGLLDETAAVLESTIDLAEVSPETAAPVSEETGVLDETAAVLESTIDLAEVSGEAVAPVYEANSALDETPAILESPIDLPEESVEAVALMDDASGALDETLAIAESTIDLAEESVETVALMCDATGALDETPAILEPTCEEAQPPEAMLTSAELMPPLDEVLVPEADAQQATLLADEFEPEVEWWDVDEERMQSATHYQEPAAVLPIEERNSSWTHADATQFQQDVSQMPETGSLTTWGDADFEDDFEFFPTLDPEPRQDVPDPEGEALSSWIPMPEEAPFNVDELRVPPFLNEDDLVVDLPADWNESSGYHVVSSVNYGPPAWSQAGTQGDIEYVERANPLASRQLMNRVEVEVEVEDWPAPEAAMAEELQLQPVQACQPEAVAAVVPSSAPAMVPEREREEDEMREVELGIAKFRRVVQVNPRNAHAWDALGTLFKAAGQYRDAILAYQQAISNDSSKSLYYHHLGLVYACEGRDEDAISAFQKVIEIDPDYSLAHATLGGYYRKMGLEELAQKHIGKAMKNIFDSENEYNRACLEAICGNADQAIELLGVALQNKQTYVDWILRDPDLDFIRQDPRFKQLISDYTR